jgi:hypothetical protein
LYTTVCIAAALVVSVGDVGGAAVVVDEGDLVVTRGGAVELDGGMAGNGTTVVCFLAEPLAITSAMTSATTSSNAAPAAIHNQRGDFGPSGGGTVSGGGSPGAWPCCQYRGSGRVGFDSVRFGPRAERYVGPYAGQYGVWPA